MDRPAVPDTGTDQPVARLRRLTDILPPLSFFLDCMRRVLVIFLIFLFPLHVFADSVDCPMPLHASAPDRLTQSETVSAVVAGFAAIDDAVIYGCSANEPSASADLNDSLVHVAPIELADCAAYSSPSYIPFPEYLLFSSISKPPPFI